MNMHVHITGKVVDELVKENDQTKFHIAADGAEYEVVSRGRQAIKDYLFVRKHQQVEVEGILEAKRIFLKKAKICLQQRKMEASMREEKNENEGTNGTDRGSGEIPEREQGRV